MGSLNVSVLGVRGFIPTPGAGSVRYGGNTVSLYIEGPGGEQIILDAGSGLFGLGRSMMKGPSGRGEGLLQMIITHAHFDHILGFPFFIPVYIPGNVIHIYGVSSSTLRLRDALEGQLNPHFSPIQQLDNMGSDIHIHDIAHEKGLAIGSLSLSFALVPHGTSMSLVVRMDTDEASVVYAPVVGTLSDAERNSLLSLIRGATVMFHDSSYPERVDACTKYGVSTADDALALAEEGGVRELRLIHYAPELDDDDIERMADRLAKKATSTVVLPSREGDTLIL